MTTAIWAPNQASIAQVETYTFSAPNGVGNSYTATINGKAITYSSLSGDTAALAATGLFNLLNQSTGVAPELTEITFANPSTAVITATASTPGTPFANVLGTSAGLVLSTGNGLSNGISTAHTKANASPSDINDPQNWLRITGSAPGVRQLPQNGDDVVIANTSVPLLWNLDQLTSIQFNTYTRWQSFTGTIGLPNNNPNGYTEWRARRFKFVGPQGSVPAGGLTLIVGFGSGSGPNLERYDLGSQKYTLQALTTSNIDIIGVHTDNILTLTNGASVICAAFPGEIANLNTVTISSSTFVCGKGTTWTTSSGGTTSSITTYGGSVTLNAAPAAIIGTNGTQFTFTTDALSYTSIIVQGGCNLTWLAGGTITTLTMTTGCTLDKSADARTLTITNSTIDGDSCQFNDPNNAIVFTNATSVKQQVTSGPFLFTGTRTVKVV